MYRVQLFLLLVIPSAFIYYSLSKVFCLYKQLVSIDLLSDLSINMLLLHNYLISLVARITALENKCSTVLL